MMLIMMCYLRWKLMTFFFFLLEQENSSSTYDVTNVNHQKTIFFVWWFKGEFLIDYLFFSWFFYFIKKAVAERASRSNYLKTNKTTLEFVEIVNQKIKWCERPAEIKLCWRSGALLRIQKDTHFPKRKHISCFCLFLFAGPCFSLEMWNFPLYVFAIVTIRFFPVA